METGVKVCDAMTHRPVSVRSSMTLAECAMLMKDKRVGSLLVRDDGNLLGILTETDIVRKAVAVQKSPGALIAKDIMHSDVVTISPEKDVFEAINLMREQDIRHLPVVDDKKLIGLLTMKDVLRIEPQLFDLLVEKLEVREEERKMQFWSDEGKKGEESSSED